MEPFSGTQTHISACPQALCGGPKSGRPSPMLYQCLGMILTNSSPGWGPAECPRACRRELDSANGRQRPLPTFRPCFTA